MDWVKAIGWPVALWVVIDVLHAIFGFAYPPFLAQSAPNLYAILVPVLVVIGLWTGWMARTAGGSMTEAAIGGAIVGIVAGVLGVVLIGYGVAGGNAQVVAATSVYGIHAIITSLAMAIVGNSVKMK